MTMKSIQLPEPERDPDLWISVLADDELTLDQRQQFVGFADSNPDVWRECAIALMDAQFLSRPQTMTLSTAERQPVERLLSEPSYDSRPPSGAVFRWASIAASLVAVFLAGWWISGQRAARQFETSLAELATQSTAAITTLAGMVESGFNPPARPMSLTDVFDNRPMLVELQDTPEYTLYVTDRAIPQSLLDAMIDAGHDVKLKPYRPRLVPAAMLPAENSLIAIEISKNVSSSL